MWACLATHKHTLFLLTRKEENRAHLYHLEILNGSSLTFIHKILKNVVRARWNSWSPPLVRYQLLLYITEVIKGESNDSVWPIWHNLSLNSNWGTFFLNWMGEKSLKLSLLNIHMFQSPHLQFITQIHSKYRAQSKIILMSSQWHNQGYFFSDLTKLFQNHRNILLMFSQAESC